MPWPLNADAPGMRQCDRFTAGFHKQGFTLVEMAVVVIVLGIAASLIVPRIGNADTSKLRSAAQILSTDLAVAQSEAMVHPDALRVLDFQMTGGLHYDIATIDIDGAPGLEDLITNPFTQAPYRVAYGEGSAYDFLNGVWLAKSNLDVDGHGGHIHFGVYGQVNIPTYTPTMILAAGNQTLAVQVDPDTGQASIASGFVPLSQLGSISMPGPSGNVHTQATSPY